MLKCALWNLNPASKVWMCKEQDGCAVGGKIDVKLSVVCLYCYFFLHLLHRCFAGYNLSLPLRFTLGRLLLALCLTDLANIFKTSI